MIVAPSPINRSLAVTVAAEDIADNVDTTVLPNVTGDSTRNYRGEPLNGRGTSSNPHGGCRRSCQQVGT